MFAVIELPVTVVPGATKVDAAVTSPKLFSYWSWASTKKSCV